MTTCADLIEETARYLLPTAHEGMNSLASGVNTTDTTLTFTYDIPNISSGSILSVGLETLYVWSAVAASKTALVTRAYQGSTAASHSASDLVKVNPRFPAFSVLQALNADIDDLSAPTNGLFQVPSPISLTYQPQINGYDLTALPSSWIDILNVRYDTPGPWKDWPELRHWQVKRNMATADFASGTALVLYDAAYPGRSVRVTYSKPFAHLTALTDDATTVAGLTATMTDIPPLGAAGRLAAVRETQRNQFESQGDPRRGQEVPTNAQLAGATALQRMRRDRIRAESARLTSNYPLRRKV